MDPKTGIKIVVESGATKSDWRIMDAEGIQTDCLLMPGMNVSSMPMEKVKQILFDALMKTGLKKLKGFYLYLAGVATPAIREELSAFLSSLVSFEEIDIQTDLLGAARGVCGRDPGIVAIIGTGSNTCFYDGANVSQKVMSGGYILGDDGSASVLGKLFLSDFIKNLIPNEVAMAFSREYDASYAAIVENVYRSGMPAKFLGSLAQFVIRYYDHPYIKDMVDRNFLSFFERSVLQYDTNGYPLGVVGGFGYACKDIIIPLAQKSGIRIAQFIKSPIDGLIRYHAL